MNRRAVLLAVLGAHLAAGVAHGSTHAAVPVPLSAWQTAVVAGTTFVGPVAGVLLDRREHPLGLPLFVASMAGALAFGGVFHFLVENPDHVGAIPAGRWQLPFGASAVAVAVTDGLGVVVGAWYWRARYRTRRPGSAAPGPDRD